MLFIDRILYSSVVCEAPQPLPIISDSCLWQQLMFCVVPSA